MRQRDSLGGAEMTARLKRLREELGLGFEIVGVGGVSNAADFDAYRQGRRRCGDVRDRGDVEPAAGAADQGASA